MNVLQIRIYFFIVLFLVSICVQILYEIDYQQYFMLNRESKEVFVYFLFGEIEVFFKKKIIDLQKFVDKEDVYNDLMMMYS